jgi:hypothetical protein
MTALVLGGLIAIVAVLFVALGALKELEFDHRTGAIDDVDYRAMVGPLRRAAADALRVLDAHMGKVKEPPLPSRAPVEPAPEPAESRHEPED